MFMLLSWLLQIMYGAHIQMGTGHALPVHVTCTGGVSTGQCGEFREIVLGCWELLAAGRKGQAMSHLQVVTVRTGLLLAIPPMLAG